MQHPGRPWLPGAPPVTQQGPTQQRPPRRAEPGWLLWLSQGPAPLVPRRVLAPNRSRAQGSRRAISSSAAQAARRGGTLRRQLLQMPPAAAAPQLRRNRLRPVRMLPGASREAPCWAEVGAPRPRLLQRQPPLVPALGADARLAVRPCRLTARVRPGHRSSQPLSLLLAAALAGVRGPHRSSAAVFLAAIFAAAQYWPMLK